MRLPSASRQALVVTADSPVGGRLAMMERSAKFRPWRGTGEPIRVSFGWNGLASGQGDVRGLPSRKEGDGRTPVGTYPLESVFGRAASFPTRMPYLAVTRDLEAVDDPASRFYNRIVDRRKIARPDWKSSEQMLRDDHVYDLGVVIGYNTNPAVPGKGSCIFLHIWKSPGAATAGCIAMPRRDIERIVRWLDPAAKPVIIIRPEPKEHRDVGR